LYAPASELAASNAFETVGIIEMGIGQNPAIERVRRRFNQGVM
jgi:hypothetical protein